MTILAIAAGAFLAMLGFLLMWSRTHVAAGAIMMMAGLSFILGAVLP